MLPDGLADKIQAKERTKKLDKFQDIILACLKKHSDMTAIQIHDRMKELTEQTNYSIKL